MTVVLFVGIFDEQRRTIERNIESLIEDQEVSDKNVRDASILDINGVPHKTTIYNLEVLNKLGMCCFRGNKKAREIRNKFNDVLIKHETQPQPTIFDYARALIAEKERSDALEAQNKALEAECDEAIRSSDTYQTRQFPSWAASPNALQRETSGTVMRTARALF